MYILASKNTMMDIINKRRSIRHFSDKPVEKTVLKGLLRAAMQAPSAGNQQPWEFLVVEDKAMLTALSEMSPYAGAIARAPAAIVFLGNTQRMRFPENWEQDMAAAAENLLLEATSCGLGAVWLGVAPLKEREEAVREIFELADNYLPFCVIPVGYTPEDVRHEYIDRFDESRICFFD